MKHDLKEQTKDIDLVVVSSGEYQSLKILLSDLGFETIRPSPEYERFELSNQFVRGEYHIDLFNRTVCGRLCLSKNMMARAMKESSFKNVVLSVCSPDDILVFKTITDRDGDLDDCINIIRRRTVDWNAILSEVIDQVSKGDEVWVTWIAERLNLLSERGVKISILDQINLLADRYFDKLEAEFLAKSTK